jgi:hypothetical protein
LPRTAVQYLRLPQGWQSIQFESVACHFLNMLIIVK